MPSGTSNTGRRSTRPRLPPTTPPMGWSRVRAPAPIRATRRSARRCRSGSTRSRTCGSRPSRSWPTRMRCGGHRPHRPGNAEEFFGVPAAGQHLESRLVLALRFENGLIAHVRLHPRTGQRRGDQDQPLVTSRPRYSQPNPAVLTTGQACPVAVTQRIPVFLGSLRFLADRRWHVACFSSWCLLACTAG